MLPLLLPARALAEEPFSPELVPAGYPAEEEDWQALLRGTAYRNYPAPPPERRKRRTAPATPLPLLQTLLQGFVVVLHTCVAK